VENMQLNKADAIERETEKLGLKYLGAIPFDPQVEESIGNPTKLLTTAIGKTMTQIKKAASDQKGKIKCHPKQ
jgi:MinD superfamily P-loop ATPase